METFRQAVLRRMRETGYSYEVLSRMTRSRNKQWSHTFINQVMLGNKKIPMNPLFMYALCQVLALNPENYSEYRMRRDIEMQERQAKGGA